MNTTQAIRAALRAGRTLSRSLLLDGHHQASQLLDGVLDGAMGERGWPTIPPHGGGPDWLYHHGYSLGWLARKAIAVEEQRTNKEK